MYFLTYSFKAIITTTHSYKCCYFAVMSNYGYYILNVMNFPVTLFGIGAYSRYKNSNGKYVYTPCNNTHTLRFWIYITCKKNSIYYEILYR